MKRFIAVLVCAFMLTGMIPAVAFADEVDVPADNQQQEQQLEQQAQLETEQQEQQPDASIQNAADQNDPAPTEEGGEQTVTYTIAVRANNASMGSVSGGKDYEENAGVTVTATAKEGFKFVKWTEKGSVVSNDAEYNFTATADRDLVAIFEPAVQSGYFKVTVRANNSARGSVAGGGEVEEGADTTVSATANEGFEFTGWKEKGQIVSTDNPYSFTVAGHRELIAIFEPEVAEEDNCKIDVSSNNESWGTVAGGGEKAKGEEVTVTATEKDGYVFAGWTEKGQIVSTDNPYSFTVETHRELVAVFEPKVDTEGNYKITVKSNNESWGTVAGGGEKSEGEEVTVTATANDGYEFVKWTYRGVEVSKANPYTFIVEGNRELIAIFEEIPPAEDDVKTTTNLKASCKTAVKGACVSFTVTVKDSANKNVEAGTVKLFVNDEEIASASAGTQITWKLYANSKNNFELGKNTVKVEYSGAEGYAASSDTVEVKVVKAACNPCSTCKPCNVCNTCTNNGKCATVRVGEDVTLKVSLSCGETCQWYVDKGDGKGFVKIKDADEAAYTVKDVTSKMDGYKYRCVITKACKVVAKPTFTLNVVSGGCLTFPKTGDVSVVFPVLAMGAAAAVLLRRKDEE